MAVRSLSLLLTNMCQRAMGEGWGGACLEFRKPSKQSGNLLTLVKGRQCNGKKESGIIEGYITGLLKVPRQRSTSLSTDNSYMSQRLAYKYYIVISFLQILSFNLSRKSLSANFIT